MKKRSLVYLALTSALVGAGILATNSKKVEKEPLNTKIVVQLKGDTLGFTEQEILDRQNAVLRQINSFANYRVTTRYTNVINGFAIEVNSKDVSKIRNLPTVERVNYNKLHSVTYNIGEIAHELGGEGEVNENISSSTMNKPDETNEGEGTLIAILDNGFYLNANYTDGDGVEHKNETHEVFAALEKGVKLHDTKDSVEKKANSSSTFHGKSKKGHSVYYNTKVPFYYDYGGQTNQSGVVGPEDFDVYSPGEDHGTHVASIAAGNAEHFKGVAPKAQLALMKVFTEYTPTPEDALEGYSASSGAYDEAILKALEDCYILNVDVINLSLGSMLSDFEKDSICEYVFNSLNEKGIFCNIAAGNEGTNQFAGSAYEYWATQDVEQGCLGYYANIDSAVQIAAAQADKEYYESAFVVDNNTISFYDQITNYTTTDGEVTYDPERHITDLLSTYPDGNFTYTKIGHLGCKGKLDGEEEEVDPYAGLDVTGHIVIVNRGEYTFLEKIAAAQNHGAIAIGIIDNDPTKTDFDFRMDLSGTTPDIPVISILHKDKDKFGEDGTTGTCKLLQNTIANNPTARLMTAFSSDGPTYDLRIKPELSAPGQSILGAVLGSTNSYEYFNGTSMATPNYCGAVALAIGEHLDDSEWRASLTDRFMSTADPMKDLYGDNYESVRRQGAGLVDIKGAVNTDVFLDGATGETLSGKAKIELKNNEDIKEGKVKLSFTAVSKAEADVNYTATTYVYRPKLVELDAEQFPEFEGKKLQATYNELIGTATQSVNVAANQNTLVNINEFDISSAEKDVINANFENGCYIEGYTILTAEGHETLVIPFLGFYGDYHKAEPVEPFAFEKDPSKVYGSDVLNSVIHKWAGLQEADYGSDWLLGYFENMENLDLEKWFYNETNLRQMKDDNLKPLVGAGENPITGVVSADDIYVGNNGATNTMILTQFVNRSVETNTLTLTNKATNEVVLIDHMFDSLFGEYEDSNAIGTSWPLYKSFASPDYWAAQIIAHRAYTIIPLYRQDKDGNNLGNYPDGEYELKITYQLAAGGSYEKTYTIHIDSELPAFKGLADVGSAYRLAYSGNIAGISFGSSAYAAPSQGADVYYYDVEKASAGEGYIYTKAKTLSGAESKSIVCLATGESFTCSKFAPGTVLTHEVKDDAKDAHKKTLAVTIKANDKVVSWTDNVCYRIKVPAGFDNTKLSVTATKGRDKYTYKVTVDDEYMIFNAPNDVKNITITDTGAVNETIASISSTLTKTDFYVGETLSTEGLITWSKTNFGDEKYIKSSDVTVDTSAVDMTQAGDYNITVTYKGLTCTIVVHVYNKDVERELPNLEPDIQPKGGCSGSVTAASGLVLIMTSLGLMFVATRKREHE